VRFEQDNLRVVELFLNDDKFSGETGNYDSVLPSRSPFNFLFVIEQTSPFLTSEMNVAAF